MGTLIDQSLNPQHNSVKIKGSLLSSFYWMDWNERPIAYQIYFRASDVAFDGVAALCAVRVALWIKAIALIDIQVETSGFQCRLSSCKTQTSN